MLSGHSYLYGEKYSYEIFLKVWGQAPHLPHLLSLPCMLKNNVMYHWIPQEILVLTC